MVTVQVYLHMLASPMVPDRTACMILIMAAGRRGAWQVAEQVTLTTLLPSFPLSALVAAGPPPGTMKRGELQLIHALCRASGATMTQDPTRDRGARTPLQAAAAAAASAVAASEAAALQATAPPPPLPDGAFSPPDVSALETGAAVTLVTTNSDASASVLGSIGVPTRPCTNSSVASGGAPAAGLPGDQGLCTPAAPEGASAEPRRFSSFKSERDPADKGLFADGTRKDAEAGMHDGRRRLASTGTDVPNHNAQQAYPLDQSVPSSMASSLLTSLGVEGGHGAGGEGQEGARRPWARTLSEPHTRPHVPAPLLPTLSSPGAAAAYSATADALAHRMDVVLGDTGAATAARPPSGGRAESLAGRSATVDSDGTSTAVDLAASWADASVDVPGEESPVPTASDAPASGPASIHSPKRSSKVLLSLLKRSVGIRQQSGSGGAHARLPSGNMMHPPPRGMLSPAPPPPPPPQTGPAPVRPGLLSGDPLARACCNALLLAYAHAEQPLIGRAVALLESMIQ